MELEATVLPILALVLAGLTWTGFGYFSAWRKNHQDKDWIGFDTKRLRDDLVLGFILGVGSVVLTVFTDGTLTAIPDAQTFLVAIASGFGVVAAVDKLIVGGILNR